MTILCVKDSVEQVRAALAVALSALPPQQAQYRLTLQRLVNDCDTMRPLVDGKHTRCTKLCGCRPL